MKSIFFSLILITAQNAMALTADVYLSPAKVNGSVFQIVVANDKRTSDNPEQTEVASHLIEVGIGKDWYTQLKLKKFWELMQQYQPGGIYYDQP